MTIFFLNSRVFLSELHQACLEKEGNLESEPFGFCLRVCPISRLEAAMLGRDACKKKKAH